MHEALAPSSVGALMSLALDTSAQSQAQHRPFHPNVAELPGQHRELRRVLYTVTDQRRWDAHVSWASRRR
jgi:hypothetical protein